MDSGLTMTAEEFERLPQKKQLTVLYRHIVAERQLNEQQSKKNRNTVWLMRGLIASDAALWCVVVFVITRMIA